MVRAVFRRRRRWGRWAQPGSPRPARSSFIYYARQGGSRQQQLTASTIERRAGGERSATSTARGPAEFGAQSEVRPGRSVSTEALRRAFLDCPYRHHASCGLRLVDIIASDGTSTAETVGLTWVRLRVVFTIAIRGYYDYKTQDAEEVLPTPFPSDIGAARECVTSVA